MGTPTLRVQEGPLQVEAHHAGNRGFEGVAHGPERRLHRRALRGDERREERGGPAAEVRSGDRLDPFAVRLVVEQDAPAAVHLEVDEARPESETLEALDRGCTAGEPLGTIDGGDQRSVHQHRQSLAHALGQRDGVGYQQDGAGHPCSRSQPAAARAK